MKKKILASLILIGLLAAAAAIGTWAYFSSTRTMNPGFYTASLNLDVGVDYDWGTYKILDNMAPGDDCEQVFRLYSTGSIGGSYSELEISYQAPMLGVEDGSTQWAEVSIPVDIAIEDITGLTFWEKIDLHGDSGWDVNVILGVDCDGDGVFEADLPAWHGIGVVAPHDPATLRGDSFVEMDGWLGYLGGGTPYAGLSKDVDWTKIDSNVVDYGWWTPDITGTKFAYFGSIMGGSFADFQAWLDGANDDGRIDLGDRVKCIKLVLGGSGSWMNECAYVKNIKLDGVLQPLPDIGEVITVYVDEYYAGAWHALPGGRGATLKAWAGYKLSPILKASDGVGPVRVTLHFDEKAGNEYQSICGNIEFTFTLWQGP